MRKKTSKNTMINIMGNPAYRGKHIIIIANKVFTAKTGGEANKILDRLEREHPKEIPAITYVPKTDTLILWL